MNHDAPKLAAASRPLVDVRQLDKSYTHRRGLRHVPVPVLNSVDLTLGRGDVVALVGGSGSGKTTLGRAIARLCRVSSGSITFQGQDVTNVKGRALREYRLKVGVVFQNPYRSLNPRLTVGGAIAEPLRVWKRVPKDQIPGEVVQLLGAVGLPDHYITRLPHELSGGERQRIAIARALSTHPELLIADEIVSSLDVSAAAEVLNLLMDLQAALGLTTLFVTHDLSVATVIADRIAVFHGGTVIEQGPPQEIMNHPRHPYTKELVTAHLKLPPHQHDRSAPSGQGIFEPDLTKRTP